MPVRTVIGTIRTPQGDPWPGFPVAFDTQRTTVTAQATLPGTAVAGRPVATNTVTVLTDADGAFSVTLEVNVPITVTLAGALVKQGTSTLYPRDVSFPIVVPEGDGPISLSTIRASEIPDPADPTLPNLVATVQGDFAALHAGLPAQIVEAIASAGTVTDAAAQAAQDALYALTAGIDGGHPSTTYDGGIVADGGTP